MTCDVAERAISARLDGERDADSGEAERHLEGCPRCRRFEADARRLRAVARLEGAAPVPDLVGRIMAEVEAAPRPARGRQGLRLAGAFVAGAVAAAILLSGIPGLRRGPAPALASQIPRRIVDRSGAIDAYAASFRVTEYGFHPRVPERAFRADVTFAAPERLRVTVRDLTEYPTATWPSNDVTLAVDGARWSLDAPTCPRAALPTCSFAARRVQAVVGREPFDHDAPAPTDVVLPMRILAGTERVRVVGHRTVLGREADVVALAYADAAPVLDFLQIGGVWRPLYPRDQVRIAVDRATSFPLGVRVTAASGAERTAWASRMGLGAEAGGAILLDLRLTSLATEVPPGWEPAPARAETAVDEGFRDRPVAGLATTLGGAPLVPAELMGLRPYRAGAFADRPGEALLSFADGLRWLTVRQTRNWNEPALFGDVGQQASPVRLPSGGTAYYEPATGSSGRRLSIHAGGWDLALESNLPRSTLLRVAASIPVEGRPVPPGWLDQITLQEALGASPSVLVPTDLPDGARLTSVHRGDAGGITMYFRRPTAELDGVGIRLHQADGVDLPPPLEPDVLAVEVRGGLGRYSASRGELEWVEEGVYRSLAGGGLDLRGLLRVAASLERPA